LLLGVCYFFQLYIAFNTVYHNKTCFVCRLIALLLIRSFLKRVLPCMPEGAFPLNNTSEFFEVTDNVIYLLRMLSCKEFNFLAVKCK